MDCVSHSTTLWKSRTAKCILEMEPVTRAVLSLKTISNLVKFRMILFRPVEGEIIVGTVLSSNMSGIRVSLEFMDDVWIPSYNRRNWRFFFCKLQSPM